jgi:hypothetical protein
MLSEVLKILMKITLKNGYKVMHENAATKQREKKRVRRMRLNKEK